jgi:hypothetical protein
VTVEPEFRDDLIARKPDGEIAPQGISMNEHQSIERVVEGLKIAADGAVHMGASDPRSQQQWFVIATMLDRIRWTMATHGGLSEWGAFELTQRPRVVGIGWKMGRKRYIDGIRGAASALRQVALCHRGDPAYLEVAVQLQALEQKAHGIPKTAAWVPQP